MRAANLAYKSLTGPACGEAAARAQKADSGVDIEALLRRVDAALGDDGQLL